MSEMNREEALESIRANLKEQLVEQLSLEDMEPADIEDDCELFGEGLGLDSLDAVEIVVLLQRQYGITLDNPAENKEIFRTINSLSEFVYEKTQGK